MFEGNNKDTNMSIGVVLYFFSFTNVHDSHDSKGEVVSLTPLYHFHPLHRHLDISRAITAESSPLHIVSSRARTGNLCFPSAVAFIVDFDLHHIGLVLLIIILNV